MKALTLILSLTGVSLFLASCGLFEAKSVGVCESLIKERLRSPSGYKRISVVEKKSEITPDDFIEFMSQNETKLSPAKIEIFSKVKHVLNEVEISYDAPNAFGTLIRDDVTCEYVSSGRNSDPLNAEIFVDGETKLDFMMRSLAAKAGKIHISKKSPSRIISNRN